MQDLFNSVTPNGAAIGNPTDNTAIVSGIVDMQGYDSLTVFIATGTLADADATFTTLVEDGDDSGLSDAAAVADTYLLGTEALASFDFSDDDSVFKIGYAGHKRYVRVTVTPAANSGASAVAIVPVLGHANQQPTPNPPA